MKNIRIQVSKLAVIVALLTPSLGSAAEQVYVYSLTKCPLNSYDIRTYILAQGAPCYEFYNLATAADLQAVHNNLVGVMVNRLNNSDAKFTNLTAELMQRMQNLDNKVSAEATQLEVRLAAKVAYSIEEILTTPAGSNGVKTSAGIKLEEIIRRLIQEEIAKAKD